MKIAQLSPFLRASAFVHVGAVLLLIAAPQFWWWPAGILLLNHALISAAGLLPRSTLLGENLVRLPDAAARRGEIAITLDDGPDPELTPQVLAILAAYEAKATFFCIGKRAQTHPELCRSIVAAGHDIENHGQTHSTLCSLFGPHGWLREVSDAQSTLQQITGRQPRFFRAMAGLRNPFLDPVLHKLGLRLASWTRRGYDTRCGDVNTVLNRLTHDLSAGDILLLHDGHAAQTPYGQAVVLEVLPRLLQELAARDLKTVTLSSAHALT